MRCLTDHNPSQEYCGIDKTVFFNHDNSLSSNLNIYGLARPPLANVTNRGFCRDPVNTTQTPAKGMDDRTQESKDEQEILSLLGHSISYTRSLETHQPGACPRVPDEFRLEVEQQWAQGHITDAVAHYYLHKLTCGDSMRVPGQNGRPSLLSAILHEDVHALAKESGWRPKRVIGKGAYGSVILWERQRRVGSSLRIASKDCLCSSFFKDYCAEGHLTRRLNDRGCKNVIHVLEWAYIKNPAYKTPDGVVHYTKPKNRICYEFAEHSDLFRLERWYKSQGLIFPEPFIWHVLYSVANALCYCRHGSNVLSSKVRTYFLTAFQ